MLGSPHPAPQLDCMYLIAMVYESGKELRKERVRPERVEDANGEITPFILEKQLFPR